MICTCPTSNKVMEDYHKKKWRVGCECAIIITERLIIVNQPAFPTEFHELFICDTSMIDKNVAYVIWTQRWMSARLALTFTKIHTMRNENQWTHNSNCLLSLLAVKLIWCSQLLHAYLATNVRKMSFYSGNQSQILNSLPHWVIANFFEVRSPKQGKLLPLWNMHNGTRNSAIDWQGGML